MGKGSRSVSFIGRLSLSWRVLLSGGSTVTFEVYLSDVCSVHLRESDCDGLSCPGHPAGSPVPTQGRHCRLGKRAILPRPHKDGVPLVHCPPGQDPTQHRPGLGHVEDLIHMELWGLLLQLWGGAGWRDCVEEFTQEVQVVSGHTRHHKDWSHSTSVKQNYSRPSHYPNTMGPTPVWICRYQQFQLCFLNDLMTITKTGGFACLDNQGVQMNEVQICEGLPHTGTHGIITSVDVQCS